MAWGWLLIGLIGYFVVSYTILTLCNYWRYFKFLGYTIVQHDVDDFGVCKVYLTKGGHRHLEDCTEGGGYMGGEMHASSYPVRRKTLLKAQKVIKKYKDRDYKQEYKSKNFPVEIV